MDIFRVIAWAEAHPVLAMVIAGTGVVVFVLAIRVLRLVWRVVSWLWARYVAPRPVEDVLTIVAASIATGVSAQGMWRFSGDVLGLDGPLRLLLFAFIEVAIITSAVRARRNMRENYSAGLDGIAVWALTCLTAVLSSMDARTLPEAVFRLAAPLVAAWLWERGMAIERHRIRGTGRINWRITPERMLVRLGLAETRDRTAQEVDAHRRLTRVALAAKKAKMLREGGASERKIRAALAKLDKAMDQAVEHTGLAVDQSRQEALLAQIAALYNTSALIDAKPASPWEPAKETPVPPIVPPQQRTKDLPAATSVPSPFPGTTPVPSPRSGGDDTGTEQVPSPPKTEDRPRPRAGTRRRATDRTVPRPRGGRTRGRAGSRPPEWDSVDELMPLGWRIVADLKKAGTNLTRDTLRDAVRASGTPISTQRATVLLQRLRAEAPAEPPLKTTPEDRPQGTNGGPSSAPAGDEPGTNGRPSSEDDKDEEGTKARPVLTDNTTTDEPHGDTP